MGVTGGSEASGAAVAVAVVSSTWTLVAPARCAIAVQMAASCA